MAVPRAVAVSILLGVVVAASGCDAFGSWEGFVYPDRSNLSSHRAIGTFGSLEECRVAALNALGDNRTGDYECGLNCKPRGGVKVCSKTER